MADGVTDFQKLAEEAAKAAYDPRAKRCYPWSHQWTMWKDSSGGGYFQQRSCVRCGKTKERAISFF